MRVIITCSVGWVGSGSADPRPSRPNRFDCWAAGSGFVGGKENKSDDAGLLFIPNFELFIYSCPWMIMTFW